MGFKIFVDTDVIIDFLIDRRPHADSSTEIFNLGEHKIVDIFTSTLCLNKVHYIIKRETGEKKAREVILELLEIIEVLAVGKEEIVRALNSDFSDFEDAIQHAVALKKGTIKSIITRNIKDYKNSDISVFTPDMFIHMINHEK